ncbi:hypothetical protein SAMN05192553_103649 [Cyclobacterium xiamenense]|uniref:MOSC domain-containing protein n=1 Tax=Cyclobacterium xiamenense TaxID=1297121 RepID=A0A1H6YDM5_9BACT|nr:MOSC N-terminal beta barrel domain-containing protein [Cyclobacterium xiamenense]SEJ39339.1 hypothetical protein SAMN05192553_103649 [Cyclobacterium xiamenense]
MKITLSGLYIYPIKSLGGISLSGSKVHQSGLQHDRQWMLVDAQGTFMSQRSLPHMALLQVSLSEDGLYLTHKLQKGSGLHIPFSADTGRLLEVRIWDDSVDALEVDPAADEWFSDMLHTSCKLVKMSSSHKRWLKKKYQVNQEHVGFADSMPFLIIGQSSLDDLNKRLDTPVPMDRFRPNMVFTGGPAYVEDGWDRFFLGSVPFKITKPCARCVMTTVDQQRGTKNREPLYTLSRYRKLGKKVLFGQNGIALDEGYITCGDAILPV